MSYPSEGAGAFERNAHGGVVATSTPAGVPTVGRAAWGGVYPGAPGRAALPGPAPSGSA